MKQQFIEDNIIILSKQTVDEMFKHEKPSDLVGLYTFYYYTAKWQKTNQIKCSTSYVAKGLNWSKERVISAKKTLKEIGLISDKVSKGKEGKITGWYIKLNYIWKQENHPTGKPEGGLNQRVENPDTNALSDNSLNASSVNIKYVSKETQTKSDSSYGDKDINKVYEFFRETLGGSLDGTVRENRRFAKSLLGRIKKDYPDSDTTDTVCKLIEMASKDSFHSRNATSFKYLYYNAQKIIQSIKSRANKTIQSL